VAPRQSTEVRRQEIVRALQQVIARSGYAGATIQAIAAAAGLAPGLVHYHFRDKREILVALVESLAGYARARFERRAAVAKTPQARLRAYIDARLAYGDDAQPDAVAAWVMIGTEAVRDPDVREVYQRTIAQELDTIGKLIRATLLASKRRTLRSKALAAALLAYTEGVFILASSARELIPTGFAADMASEWVQRYVDAEPAASARKVSRR
jgi:TetR/AcrR family transcriptional repressor of bet genes